MVEKPKQRKRKIKMIGTHRTTGKKAAFLFYSRRQAEYFNPDWTDWHILGWE